MLLAVLGAILLFMGLPITIVIVIVSSIKEKRVSRTWFSIPIVFGISLFLIIAGATISDTDNETGGTDEKIVVEKEEIKKENLLEFEKNGVSVKYLEHKISGNDLYVYFEMTNESNENITFDYSYSVKAFQDGIELEQNYIYDCDEEENGSKEIQPGATITVAEVFKLNNMESNVEVDIEYWISFSGEKLLEFVIELK